MRCQEIFAAFALVMMACAPGESPKVPKESDKLLATGVAMHEREQYDSASAVLRLALAAARSDRDERTEALVLTRLGLAAWRMGDLPAAAAAHDSALKIKLRQKMTDELSRSYNGLGLLALSENRNADAAHAFEQALSTAIAVNDSVGAVRAIGNAALAYAYMGDLRRAREGHRSLREAGRKFRDSRLEANGLANEAMIDVAEGDPIAAIARLDSARMLYRRISYMTGEQNALGQLSTAYELMGEYGRALSVLDSALHLARTRGAREQEIETLRLLGGLHVRIGDHRRGAWYYAQAQRAAEAAGMQADAGSIHRGAAEAQLLLGNVRGAHQHAETALALHTAAEELLDQLDDALLLARIEERQGNRMAARARLAAAQSYAEEIGTRQGFAQVGLARANQAASERDDRAVLLALQSVDSVSRSLDFEVQWIAAASASRAYTHLGSLDSAIRLGYEAVNSAERVRSTLAAAPLRSAFAAERASVYGDLVVNLLRAGRSEAAFQVSDRARSRGLLEHLAGARANARAGVGDLAAADELLRRIDALVEALRNSEPSRRPVRGGNPETAPVQTQLAAARAEYEALMLRASASDKRAAAVAGAGTVSLENVRNLLAPGEVLIEYFVTDDRVLGFAVRRGGLETVAARVNKTELAERVRLLHDLWSRPEGWRAAVPVSEALYKILLEPLRSQPWFASARRLVIVPHGVLSQTPFAALRDPRSRRFAGEDFGMAFAPSALAFSEMRSRDMRFEFANAAWGFAPFARELPASVLEVRAFAATVMDARTLTGGDATESSLRHALQDPGIVHIATHGVLNRQHPLFSRIDLQRGRGNRGDDDGRLEIRELLSLPVRSNLVFLSGCETGAAESWLPEPVRGSGELTLSQAFLVAGAGNVVSTLWRIDDVGASVFAGRFYRYLKGRSPAEALVLAQREMMKDARYASPYYWAGYVVSGSASPASAPARMSSASVR